MYTTAPSTKRPTHSSALPISVQAGGKGTTEDEMFGCHHQLNGHEFEQTLRDSEGQGSLACCCSWGHKQVDVTEQLNNKMQ